jgi:chromosome segregation ATPase
MSSPTSETELPADHLLRQLIDAIAAHPEVREPLLRVLLTEDFLTLPKRVDRLQGEFEEFREETRAGFRGVNERIDATNERLDSTNERIDTTNEQLAATNERIDTTNEQLAATNERIDTTNTEVRTLSDRLDATNTEVRTLSDRIDTTNTEVRTLSDRIDATNTELRTISGQLGDNTRAIRRLEGHMGRLLGHTYEDRCRHEIGVILDGWLTGPVLADRSAVNAKLLEARQSGEITRDEYLDGLRPDIIARENQDAAQTGRLAVVEASVTFNRGDLESAARRAAIISGVTGVGVAAFVATHGEWPREVDADAQRLGVTIVHHEAPEFEDNI